RLDPGSGASGCGGCGKCSGERHAAVVAALTDLPLAAGDRVQLRELVSPLRAALAVFGWPLLLLLLGIGGGQLLGGRLMLPGRGAEWLAFLLGGAGLLAGLLLAARTARRGPRAAWQVLAKQEPKQ
ncbi:MAG TPA: SoxR reducing system RseC family protein, partial [bacterium]|nr:SoxR reducing system RseC family protein [bacterium]